MHHICFFLLVSATEASLLCRCLAAVRPLLGPVVRFAGWLELLFPSRGKTNTLALGSGPSSCFLAWQVSLPPFLPSNGACGIWFVQSSVLVFVCVAHGHVWRMLSGGCPTRGLFSLPAAVSLPSPGLAGAAAGGVFRYFPGQGVGKNPLIVCFTTKRLPKGFHMRLYLPEYELFLGSACVPGSPV